MSVLRGGAALPFMERGRLDGEEDVFLLPRLWPAPRRTPRI
jgi:hypothetical protein